MTLRRGNLNIEYNQLYKLLSFNKLSYMIDSNQVDSNQIDSNQIELEIFKE